MIRYLIALLLFVTLGASEASAFGGRLRARWQSRHGGHTHAACSTGAYAGWTHAGHHRTPLRTTLDVLTFAPMERGGFRTCGPRGCN